MFPTRLNSRQIPAIGEDSKVISSSTSLTPEHELSVGTLNSSEVYPGSNGRRNFPFGRKKISFSGLYAELK